MRNKLKNLMIILCLTAVISGCQEKQAAKPKYALVKVKDRTEAKKKGYQSVMIDDEGRLFGRIRDAERVVSLAPAVTEIIYALNAESKLVGNTSYCDYPPEAKKITKVGDFMNPNVEKVISLKPDLILSTGGVQQNLISKFEATDIPVFIIDPRTYTETGRAITKIGVLTGKVREGILIYKKMEQKKEALLAGDRTGKRPKVFIELGKDPLYTAGAGTFMDDMIRICGGENIAVGEGWLPYNLEALLEADPDVYIAIKGDMYDPGRIEKRPEYSDLKAVRGGKVFIIEDDLITIAGPRLVEGLSKLASAIQSAREQ